MNASKRTHYVIFGLGAAVGSAVGLVLGSILTYCSVRGRCALFSASSVALRAVTSLTLRLLLQ
jgi:hypothetical protein